MGVPDISIQPSVQLAAQQGNQRQQHQEPHHQQQQLQQYGRYPQLQVPGTAHFAPPSAVLAPAGYSVSRPAAPPPQLPTPFIDCQRPTCCSSDKSSSSCSSKGSSCCKPVAAQHHQQYNLPHGQQYNQQQYSQQQYNQQQQQQYHGMPAYPVSVCVGQPVSTPMAQQQEKEDDCCQCTLGWALYGLGWIFPLCWVAAVILPFLTKTQGDKRAAIASGVTLGVLVVLAVLVTVVIISVAAANPTNW